MSKQRKLKPLTPGMKHGLYTTYRRLENARARLNRAEPGTEEKAIAHREWVAAKKELREFEKRIGVREKR